MSYDRSSRCESCRGLEHANAALTPQVSCTHCVRLPRAHRQGRADALAAAAEDDWLVQEFYSLDQALYLLDPSGGQQSGDSFPSIHGSPCGSPGLSPSPPVGETGRGPGVSPVAEPRFGCRADDGSTWLVTMTTTAHPKQACALRVFLRVATRVFDGQIDNNKQQGSPVKPAAPNLSVIGSMAHCITGCL
ncbi:hypothetical protein CesoFtcFv8_010737 [Champsocephalus esox]|uniref:Uncharacterized protein n=1 Tax=Champsocephalus esox TaxID=159716 RepID=A0AAN8BZK5_9TELE|nr:hypothetical protein CesoFtcFv8_010737 [Champsocephalus esox]